MHSLSVPPTPKNVLSSEINPCRQLVTWWQSRREKLLATGVEPGKIIFDPGIGFGKSAQQNLYILSHLDELFPVKEEIMIGHSRKSFLKLLADRNAGERDTETAVVTARLNLAYAQYLRVHDVQSQQAAL